MQRQVFMPICRWGPKNLFKYSEQPKIGRLNFHSLRSKEIKSHKRKVFPWIKSISVVLFGGLFAYDGVKNDFTHFKAAKRFMHSLQIAALISCDYVWVMYMESDKENYDDILKELHLKSANRILNGCLRNGGLYIKVGQGVAAINHILPDEYTSTLSQLHDKCLPTTPKEIKQVFVEDFGMAPEEVYMEFDYTPIAAASLAQVFKAKTKAGEDVAVKVQYLDLQKRFSSDLGTIVFLQDVIEFFFKGYNFGWIFRKLRKNLEMEMDFIHEGQNAEKCALDLKDFKYVYVPKVHWDLTTLRVLTLEWIDGYKVTDLDMIKKDKLNLHDMDKKLFTVFAEQIFSSGFIHGDPHPGNIFVRMRNGSTQIILLDHGLYEVLPRNLRLQLCKFWEATVLEDLKTMKETAEKLNVTGYKNFAEVLFQVPFDLHGGKIKSKLTEEDIAYMRDIAKNHFNEVMITLQQMPISMLLVVRNLNTIRSIGKEHGDPVDRPKLMARYAQKCLFRDENVFISYIRWVCRRIHFEYCLIKKNLFLSFLSLYLEILYKLGRSPERIQILGVSAKVDHT